MQIQNPGEPLSQEAYSTRRTSVPPVCAFYILILYHSFTLELKISKYCELVASFKWKNQKKFVHKISKVLNTKENILKIKKNYSLVGKECCLNHQK